MLDSRSSSLVEGGFIGFISPSIFVLPLAHLPRFLRTPRDLLGMSSSLLKSENAWCIS
ncbi:hypothetical protein BYT27DRAFT_7191178 [Phlegmacium glaucopus]|nr:hypothetical protein BYT27DRAFT_7191178 [Phlegmacium glaucopus]